MDYKTIVLQLLTAFLGSIGFSLLFGMRGKHLIPASLGGVLVWGLYILFSMLIHDEGFMACLIAAAAAVIYAEALAHLRKCPATIFVIPAIIPLVPGSGLYYTMANAVRGNIADAKLYGSQTLETALAIAAGISFVIALRQLNTKRES